MILERGNGEQTKGQTEHTLSYTVEYYQDDVHVKADDQRIEKSVPSGTNQIPVDAASINIKNKYEGYHFDHSDPAAIPATVRDGSTIKVYYSVNHYNYTVSHIYRDRDEAIVESLTTTSDDENRDYRSSISESIKNPQTPGDFLFIPC